MRNLPPTAKRLLWVGPWRVEDPWASVRSSMFIALRRQGWSVSTVILGRQSEEWILRGVDNVITLQGASSRLDSLRYLLELSWIIFKFKGEFVVLGHMSPHFAVAAWLGKRLFFQSKIVVLDVRTLPSPSTDQVEVDKTKERLFWGKMRFGMAFAEGWLAITDRVRCAVIDQIGTRAQKLPQAIWASGVDGSFLNSETVAPWTEITKKGHRYNVLYLGSLGKGRCLDLAIRAMRLLGKRGEVGLHFVGEGNARASLQTLVTELGLQDCVHIYPSVPYLQTVSVIKACDIGILPLPDCPAWRTSSPLKLFEYMAQRKPVLISTIAAHTDLLQGKPFAFFMDEYSPEGFCRALEQFLQLAPAEQIQRGDAAWEFVRKGHTYDHRAQTINNFLGGLSAQKSLGQATTNEPIQSPAPVLPPTGLP